MKPLPRKSTDFEKVAVGEYISGVIAEIDYDMKHKFKGFQGGKDTERPAVRLVFELTGYEFKHRTRWMSFNYSDRSNLYNKYLRKLVEGAEPDMDFDLDALKNFPVQTIWDEQNGFQFIELIKPQGDKCALTAFVPPTDEKISDELEEAFADADDQDVVDQEHIEGNPADAV